MKRVNVYMGVLDKGGGLAGFWLRNDLWSYVHLVLIVFSIICAFCTVHNQRILFYSTLFLT
jgi:hypothetical protein